MRLQIHQNIEIAVIAIIAANHASKNARVEDAGFLDKTTDGFAVLRQDFGWTHDVLVSAKSVAQIKLWQKSVDLVTPSGRLP